MASFASNAQPVLYIDVKCEHKYDINNNNQIQSNTQHNLWYISFLLIHILYFVTIAILIYIKTQEDILYPTKIMFARRKISNSLPMNECVPIKCGLNFGTQNTSQCLIHQKTLHLFSWCKKEVSFFVPFYPN